MWSEKSSKLWDLNWAFKNVEFGQRVDKDILGKGLWCE